MDSIKDKIAKIHELVQRGTTAGERAAAENQLNKLQQKYNLTEEFMKTIHLRKYEFKYATNLGLQLFIQLHEFFLKDKPFSASRSTRGKKAFSFLWNMSIGLCSPVRTSILNRT